MSKRRWTLADVVLHPVRGLREGKAYRVDYLDGSKTVVMCYADCDSYAAIFGGWVKPARAKPSQVAGRSIPAASFLAGVAAVFYGLAFVASLVATVLLMASHLAS